MLERVLTRSVPVLVLAILASSCCSLFCPDAGGPGGEVPVDPPEEGYVFGSATFTGAPGGVIFEITAYDTGDLNYTGEAHIKVWEGFRDPSSTTEPLPDALNVPSEVARVASRPQFPLRYEGPWQSNEVHVTDPEYTSSETQFWVFVEVRFERIGSPPFDKRYWRYEWLVGNSSSDVTFQEL